MRKFLIWSIEHEAWWRPGWAGYTVNIGEAGVYWKPDAEKILERANLVKVNECAVPFECVVSDTAGLGSGPL